MQYYFWLLQSVSYRKVFAKQRSEWNGNGNGKESFQKMPTHSKITSLKLGQFLKKMCKLIQVNSENIYDVNPQ